MSVVNKRWFFCAVMALACSLTINAQIEVDRYGVAVNKKPLRDFSAATSRKIGTGDVDLKALFRVEFVAVLDKSAKIDTAKSRVVKRDGDAKMVGLATDAILAVGESGYLGYLTRVESRTERLLITVGQTKGEFEVTMRVTTPSQQRAQQTASGLSVLFRLASLQVPESKETDKWFLSKTSVVADNHDYVIKLLLTPEQFQKVVTAELAKKSNDE